MTIYNEAEIERLIEEWHASTDGHIASVQLHEHLGMTWEEYKRWVVGEELYYGIGNAFDVLLHDSTEGTLMPKKIDQGYINHIALVLDSSTSMNRHARSLVAVADAQIKHLALRSTELNQETRVTVYTFADETTCVVYDKDVLRLPSIKAFYQPEGWTALVDATLKSIDDLAQTPELYGDHAFLIFVLTDGAENRSKRLARELEKRLRDLPENWTVAILVPDQAGKFEAKKFGFPADNIAIWDTTSDGGVAEGVDVIRAATDTYMKSRGSGLYRGTKTLFNTTAAVLNKQTVQAAGLTPLKPSEYMMVPVTPQGKDKNKQGIEKIEIRDFVIASGLPFRMGRNFYQLSKKEIIQLEKEICIEEKRTGKIFSGAEARSIIGLPDMTVRVAPDYNPEYTVFVQSTSNNRYLIVGTKLLVLI